MAAPDKTDTESGQSSTNMSFLPAHDTVNEFSQSALKAVVQGIKTSHNLPTLGDDYDYYSSFRGFGDVLDYHGNRVLHIIQALLKQQNFRGNFADDRDVEDKFDQLIDANDHILEKVGSSLDEAAGLKKNASPLVVATATPTGNSASWNKKISSNKAPGYKLFAAKNIQRPQLFFKDKVDNTNRPFVPKIKHKPNAMSSLEESLKISSIEDAENPDFVFPHPYKYEIANLKQKAEFLETVNTQQPREMSATPLKYIDTESDLGSMCQKLKKQKEIAVDLEHHSYRTYLGFTCLIQISTRQEDYIVDTLELRSSLYMLNNVFTDANILKVFHGSDSDVEWLQRDFGVYIVNMFDTGQAARVLGSSRFSLSHLLQTYCQVEADKQYQLADWRIRPLPSELIKYAREDTHYLLYIHDMMRKELIERGNEHKNLLNSVYQRSSELCCKVYKKPFFHEDSYLNLYRKNRKVFNSQQTAALEGLFSWRDRVARMEDESTGFVLPNHMLLHIADSLPKEYEGIMACCNPIPPMVRQYINELHSIIMEAREKPLFKTQAASKPIKAPSDHQHPKYNINNILNCPHDLSHQDSETHVPTMDCEPLVKIKKTSDLFPSEDAYMLHDVSLLIKSEPVLTAFCDKKEATMSAGRRKALDIMKAFVNPFEKYLPCDVIHETLRPAKIKSSPAQPINLIDQTWKLMKNTPMERLSSDEVKDPVQTELPRKRQKIEVKESQQEIRSLRDKGALTKKKIKKKKSLNVSVTAKPTVNDISSVNLKGEVVENLKVTKKKKKRFVPAEYTAEAPIETTIHALGSTSHEGEIVVVKKKKKKKIDASNIQPFDYDKADKSIFKVSTSKPGADVFNPGGVVGKEKKFKKKKKSGNQKSMTFSSKKK